MKGFIAVLSLQFAAVARAEGAVCGLSDSASAKMDTSAKTNIAYRMPFICRGDCHFHLSLRLQKYNFSTIWPNFSSFVDNSHIINPYWSLGFTPLLLKF